MMNSPKDISYSDDLRKQLYEGVRKLSDAVKVTMGPRGRNVLIDNDRGADPHITKDGVTVASAIHLKDPIENMGARLVKSVSVKTAEEAGDGTTTATVLAHAIFKEGLRNVTSGANPIELKRGMDKACDVIVKNIASMAKPVETKEQIKQVATISANSDESIGSIIADAMDAVGKDGVITIEEAKGMVDELEVVQGMRNTSGMLSSYFTTSSEKIETTFEDPYILFYQGRITNLKDMVKVLEVIQKENKSLLIVSDEIDNDVLNTLVVNKLRGALNVCAVKSSGVGLDRSEQLEDFAILTGGKVISSDKGESLSSITMEHLGRASKAIVNLNSTTIVNGLGDPEEIQKRIDVIKSLQQSEDKIFHDRYQRRIAKLSGGVAILRIGAPTEAEMKEKKDRVDDALAATKAAVAEGIVIGGGSALIKASKDIVLDLVGDQAIGADIVVRAVKDPIKQIATNAGYSADVVADQVLSSEPDFGFNAASGEYVNMFEAGIIDPAKVERVALQQAVSVSSLLLTSEAGITSIVEDK